MDPITGRTPTKESPATNPVLAVKIENTEAARPQIGLAEADMVIVEEVEARITRLIAIFHSQFPTKVGPVRSARNTDLRILPMFGKPGLVYSGANGKVQRQIKKSPVVRLERSDRDKSRSAPHNVMVDLRKLARTKELEKARDIGFDFSPDDRSRADAKQATPKAKIGVDIFTFDHGKDGYTPQWNGKPCDGTVRADNVVILEVRNRKDSDTTSDLSIVSETVGKGKVAVHRDGTVRYGTWQRPALNGPMRLVDADDRDIPLAPGCTWVLLRGQ